MAQPTPSSVFGRQRSIEQGLFAAPVEAAETSRDDESIRARTVDLGNPELPIAQYREQIVDAVDDSQVVVLVAETGAGKSTQVPQFLAEAGYKVIMTQPRIVAARNVSMRIRDEIVAKKGEQYADFVGYRTAQERGDSPENRILTVTEGLQLVRELSQRKPDGEKRVLVFDEAHEWNKDMEVLVAWAKKRMAEDPDFKVVVMSATMEAGPLAKYFADDKREVPVIEVPGRTYPVERHEEMAALQNIYEKAAVKAAELAQAGKSSLVFAPGEGEIQNIIAMLEAKNIGATILPLYGKLSQEEQQRAFATYDGPKIVVATNVAQTSVTVEGIDAVVDTGLQRTKRVKNGVEGLFLEPISKADCLQRAGRAGRTKPGEYYLISNTSLENREAYGTPEILRTHLDGTVLRLAKAGIDIADFDFYNVENRGKEVRERFAADIAQAKGRLEKLGALTEVGNITRVGRQMERMPLESHYARMMIEARQYGPEVQMQLAAMLAVQEAGGICQFKTKNKPCDERWRGLLAPDMNDSDAIKQLEVFVAAERMSDGEKRNHDIYTKAFSKSREILRQLRGVEKLHDQDLSPPTKEQREQLVKCIIAGMVDNLYISDAYGDYRNAQGDVREASSRSVIRPSKMVVGSPFNRQINTRRGPKTLRLLENPTNVPSVEVLREVAPQLFAEEFVGYDMQDGKVVERREAVFNGTKTGQEVIAESTPSQERLVYVVDNLCSYGSPHTRQLRDTASALHTLNMRTAEELPTFTGDTIRQLLMHEIPMDVVDIEQAAAYIPEIVLTDIVPAEKIAEIEAASPAEYAGMELEYGDSAGRPRVKNIKSADLLEWDGPTELPDGRDILIVRYSNYSSRLVPMREARQVMLEERERHIREEEERRKAEARQPLVDALAREVRDAEQEPLGRELRDELWDIYVRRSNTDEWMARAQEGLQKAKIRIGELEQEERARQQLEDAQRERLGGVLKELGYGASLELAVGVEEWSSQVVERLGADRAWDVIGGILDAPYGKDRQHTALVGALGYELARAVPSGRASDLNAFLSAALVWIDTFAYEEDDDTTSDEPSGEVSSDSLAALAAMYNNR